MAEALADYADTDVTGAATDDVRAPLAGCDVGLGGVLGVDIGPPAAGTGVEGVATASGQSGTAGIGTSKTGGHGAYGSSDNGVGVYAASTAGTALQVAGKARFGNSGVATVAAGTGSVAVTLAGVTAASIVLATIQQLVAGVAVAAAAPSPGSRSVAVGWFVIG
jgi:hypothetical protein